MNALTQEHWKSNHSASKRKDRAHADEEEGGHGEKRRRRGGKRRKKDKTSKQYDLEEADMDVMDEQDEMEEDAKLSNEQEDDGGAENPQDLLAAAGLEDSDADDETVFFYILFNQPDISTYIFCSFLKKNVCFIKGAPVQASNRRRRAWSESDDDEPSGRRPAEGDNSPALHVSDGEARENENVDGDEDE